MTANKIPQGADLEGKLQQIVKVMEWPKYIATVKYCREIYVCRSEMKLDEEYHIWKPIDTCCTYKIVHFGDKTNIDSTAQYEVSSDERIEQMKSGA